MSCQCTLCRSQRKGEWDSRPKDQVIKEAKEYAEGFASIMGAAPNPRAASAIKHIEALLGILEQTED